MARFVVMRDQNGEDCHSVKAKLDDLCARGGRPDSLARVVCRELEAWYVGDVDALAKAYPDTARRIRTSLGKRRFRDPDNVSQPARALAKLITGLPETHRRPCHGQAALSREQVPQLPSLPRWSRPPARRECYRGSAVMATHGWRRAYTPCLCRVCRPCSGFDG